MSQQAKRPWRGFKDSVIWFLLSVVPKKLMSRLAGRAVSIRWPKPMNKWIINSFARIFKINLDEVEGCIDDYPTLQSFFTRHLKSGAREIDQHPLSFVSPCDGAFGQSGRIENGLMLQVKGQSFELKDLICDEHWGRELEGGSYAVLYLSPRDYHRYHAPCRMAVKTATHVPGELWPVNLWAVRSIEKLFCVNERVVLKLESGIPSATPFAMVFVGATMVGSVKFEFDQFMTTNRASALYMKTSYDQSPTFVKGQELGRFEFGSTIVLIIPKNVGVLDSCPPGTSVTMGQRIGIINEE